MEGAMAATRREGNRLKKGLGAKLEAVYDAQAENCECYLSTCRSRLGFLAYHII
jgi:hypothetical protein